MSRGAKYREGIFSTRGRLGAALLILGEALILIRLRPLSDYYFPIVWIGLIVLLDGTLRQGIGHSPWGASWKRCIALFGLSAIFWWFFELLNQFVHNWVYVGGPAYSSPAFIAIATVDFSTVLPAVCAAAFFVAALLPVRLGRPRRSAPVPGALQVLMLCGALLCFTLPVLFPHYAFGLIWGSAYLLLDPINYRLGRPSIIGPIWQGNWRPALSFALGALMCGFCWEAWNFWSMPKWTYDIPLVGFWHIFEMPLLGWLGYLPFGLELFAMTNFLLPLLRLGNLALPELEEGSLKRARWRASENVSRGEDRPASAPSSG